MALAKPTAAGTKSSQGNINYISASDGAGNFLWLLDKSAASGTVLVADNDALSAGINYYSEPLVNVVHHLTAPTPVKDSFFTVANVGKGVVDIGGVQLIGEGQLEYTSSKAGDKWILTSREGAVDVTTEKTAKTFKQVAHGFTKVGQPVYHDGTKFQLADSTDDIKSDMVGVVGKVIDVDNFELITEGYCQGIQQTGLTPGAVFLSATAGVLTETVPTTGFFRPVMLLESPTSGWVIQRGSVDLDANSAATNPSGLLVQPFGATFATMPTVPADASAAIVYHTVLTADDIGSGTAMSPQYQKGFYKSGANTAAGWAFEANFGGAAANTVLDAWLPSTDTNHSTKGQISFAQVKAAIAEEYRYLNTGTWDANDSPKALNQYISGSSGVTVSNFPNGLNSPSSFISEFYGTSAGGIQRLTIFGLPTSSRGVWSRILTTLGTWTPWLMESPHYFDFTTSTVPGDTYTISSGNIAINDGDIVLLRESDIKSSARATPVTTWDKVGKIDLSAGAKAAGWTIEGTQPTSGNAVIDLFTDNFAKKWVIRPPSTSTTPKTLHDFGLATAIALKSADNGSECHIEGTGKGYSIKATDCEDGNRFRLINTSGADQAIGLTFSGFAGAFLRNGSEDITLTSPMSVPKANAYDVTITKNGALYYLNLVPFGGAKPEIKDGTANWEPSTAYAASEVFFVTIPASGVFKDNVDYVLQNNSAYVMYYPVATVSGSNLDIAETAKMLMLFPQHLYKTVTYIAPATFSLPSTTIDTLAMDMETYHIYMAAGCTSLTISLNDPTDMLNGAVNGTYTETSEGTTVICMPSNGRWDVVSVSNSAGVKISDKAIATDLTAGTSGKWLDAANYKALTDALGLILGVPLSDGDLGAFTKTTLTDDKSLKTLLQEIENTLEAQKISGRFIGSAATFATLPTTSAATGAAVNGDWAVLSADDGANKRGVWITNGSVYTFAFALSSSIAPLTDTQIQDKADATNTGTVSGKLLYDREQALKGVAANFLAANADNAISKTWDAKTLSENLNNLLPTVQAGLGAPVNLATITKPSNIHVNGNAGEITWNVATAVDGIYHFAMGVGTVDHVINVTGATGVFSRNGTANQSIAGGNITVKAGETLLIHVTNNAGNRFVNVAKLGGAASASGSATVQTGSHAFGSTGTGTSPSFAVTFPQPFANPPIIELTYQWNYNATTNGSALSPPVILDGAPSTTGFNYRINGGRNTLDRVLWTAIDPLTLIDAGNTLLTPRAITGSITSTGYDGVTIPYQIPLTAGQVLDTVSLNGTPTTDFDASTGIVRITPAGAAIAVTHTTKAGATFSALQWVGEFTPPDNTVYDTLATINTGIDFLKCDYIEWQFRLTSDLRAISGFVPKIVGGTTPTMEVCHGTGQISSFIANVTDAKAGKLTNVDCHGVAFEVIKIRGWALGLNKVVVPSASTVLTPRKITGSVTSDGYDGVDLPYQIPLAVDKVLDTVTLNGTATTNFDANTGIVRIKPNGGDVAVTHTTKTGATFNSPQTVSKQTGLSTNITTTATNFNFGVTLQEGDEIVISGDYSNNLAESTQFYCPYVRAGGTVRVVGWPTTDTLLSFAFPATLTNTVNLTHGTGNVSFRIRSFYVRRDAANKVCIPTGTTVATAYTLTVNGGANGSFTGYEGIGPETFYLDNMPVDQEINAFPVVAGVTLRNRQAGMISVDRAVGGGNLALTGITFRNLGVKAKYFGTADNQAGDAGAANGGHTFTQRLARGNGIATANHSTFTLSGGIYRIRFGVTQHYAVNTWRNTGLLVNGTEVTNIFSGSDGGNWEGGGDLEWIVDATSANQTVQMRRMGSSNNGNCDCWLSIEREEGFALPEGYQTRQACVLTTASGSFIGGATTANVPTDTGQYVGFTIPNGQILQGVTSNNANVIVGAADPVSGTVFVTVNNGATAATLTPTFVASSARSARFTSNAGVWTTFGTIQLMMAGGGSRSAQVRSAFGNIDVVMHSWTGWDATSGIRSVNIGINSNEYVEPAYGFGNAGNNQFGWIHDVTNNRRFQFIMTVGAGYNGNTFFITEVT